ncbi:MAG: hypothetical protein HKN43_13640 [Rhodothermales bacterium]|nr:hypothetical protein [Rhodothermales bacterium]
MKNRIQFNKRGVLAIVLGLFMIALYAPDVSAQGRSSSKAGKKERVEKKSESKQKASTSKRTTRSSDAKTSKRTVQRKATTSSSRANRSASQTNRGTARNPNGSSGRLRSSKDKVDSGQTRSRKTFKTVDQTKPKDGRGQSTRGSSGDKSGKASTGRSGNSSGSGVRTGSGGSSDGSTGVRSGSRGNSGSGNGRAVGGGDSRDNGNSRGSRVVGSGDNRGSSGVRGTRDGNRSRYIGPVVRDRNNVKKYRYSNKHKWQNTYFRPDRVHVHVYPRNWHRHIHVSSHVHIGIAWPWQKRYHRHWQPRYRYRQVVYVNVGWGRNTRQSRIDVRTYYKQRIRHANSEYAEIEIDIDSIELYENGRFIGYVDRIPSKLREINATVYSNGRVEFDRNVFLIGDIYRGFEMISTRYYDDYLLNSYDRNHGVRVGRLDLRREKVRSVRRSRLFAANRFNGNVPISLLPEDDRLFDYSYEHFSGYYRDNNGRYDSDFLGSNGFAPDRSEILTDYESGLQRIDEVSYSTNSGANVEIVRESALERIE